MLQDRRACGAEGQITVASNYGGTSRVLALTVLTQQPVTGRLR